MPPALPRPLRGIVPPMVTPLSTPDTLDRDGLQRLIEHILSAPIAALFILGTTGEGPSLSGRLRRELIDHVVRQVNDRVPVLVGITDPSLRDSVQLADYAADAGVTAIVAAPPYYFRPSTAELTRWIEYLAEQLRLPLFVYNMPAFTKVCIPLEVIRRAMQLPNVIGLKDSSGDVAYLRAAQELIADRSDWSLLVGPEHLTADFVSNGGHGGVNGGANFLPHLFTDLCRAAEQRDAVRVAELQQTVMRIGRIYTFGDSEVTVIQGAKAALASLGICSDVMAEPHRPLAPETREVIRRIVAER